MKFKILALLLCACLLTATLAGCGVKLSPDTGASPDTSASSSSPGSSGVSGDASDVETLIGIVDNISAGTVTLKVAKPYDAPSTGDSEPPSGLVGSGSYLYMLQAETMSFTLNNSTIVILEDKGYVPGMISDIMPGDFLAAALKGDTAITIVDNGRANIITSGTGQSGTTNSGGGDDITAVQPNPSGQMTPAPGDTTDTSGTVFTVTTDNLKARSGPGTSFDILGQLSMGTTLTGTVTDGWLKFVYNGKTAYCMAEYLKPASGGSSSSSSSSPSSSATSGTEKTYKVTEADLKVRSGPGTSYDILGKLALGEKVTGVVSNGWLKFNYEGKTAYCSANFLEAA